jgi:hypothetical protein
MNSMSFTSLMLTCLQTTGAENLTRRAAIETKTDIAGADNRTIHSVLMVAAVKKTESIDIAPRTKGELIDLEMETRVAAEGILIATTNLAIVATATKKKCRPVTHVVKPMRSLEVLVDLKNREPRAIAVTKICDRANPVELKNLLRVASPRKTRVGSVEGDPLVLITGAIALIRPSQAHPAHLPEHPGEIAASLPTTVLEVLVANAEQQMNKPRTIDANQKGQSDECGRNLTEDANLRVTVSHDRRRRRGRDEARAKSPNVSPNVSQNPN